MAEKPPKGRQLGELRKALHEKSRNIVESRINNALRELKHVGDSMSDDMLDHYYRLMVLSLASQVTPRSFNNLSFLVRRMVVEGEEKIRDFLRMVNAQGGEVIMPKKGGESHEKPAG